MAFVYCDNRWKDNEQTDTPGPGEYLNQKMDQQQAPMSQQTLIKYKLMKSMIKKQVNKNSQNSANDIITCINKQEIKNKVEKHQHQKMTRAKRKQLLLSNSSQSVSKPSTQNIDLVGCITNITKSGSQTRINSKWGNMKLKEILKEMSKITENGKDYSKSKSKVYKMYPNHNFRLQKKEIFQEERRQLENHFNQARKGTLTINKKYWQRQKENCIKVVNQRLSIQNQKEEPHQRRTVNLQVQPNFAYRTEERNIGIHSRPLTTCKSSESSLQNIEVYRKDTIQTHQHTEMEDASFEDQDSIQYIQDATPGPGTYNLASESLIKKKNTTNIEKFGVTIQRFKSQKRLFYEAQTPIHPVYPQFKKQSKAPLEEVAFGKSLKEQKSHNYNINDNFYEDYNTLENKNKKLLWQNRNQNLCFQSSKERFKQEKKEINIEDLVLQNTEKQQAAQNLDNLQNQNGQRPMNVFLSKVPRNLVPQNLMQDVNYHGQNYNCIANKLKKQIDRLQQFELKPAYFLTSSKRFDYKEYSKQNISAQVDENFKNQSAKVQELKIMKVASIKKKRQDDHKKIKKGYTFTKQSTSNLFGHLQKTPSPDKYNYKPSWVKNTYNLKFMIRQT